MLGQEDFDMEAFSFHPNPVKDIVNISYNADITAITVYNILGQQALVQQPNATHAAIDMLALQDGAYIVVVASGKAVKTIKWLRSKLNLTRLASRDIFPAFLFVDALNIKAYLCGFLAH